MGEELQHGLLLVEEGDDRFVHARELLILGIASRVVYGTAVEDEATSVAREVVGDTLLVGEAGDAHRQLRLLLTGGEEG